MPFLLPSTLIIATVFTSVGTGLNLAIPIILICATWAAWDASKIGTRHFHDWLGRGPIAVFLLVTLLWFVAFPAYLELRERIRDGVATPRPGLNSDEVRRLVLAARR